MDRLETFYLNDERVGYGLFTFQYGQIRNRKFKNNLFFYFIIYIPVWIDQKPSDSSSSDDSSDDLHSSMDRLETYIYLEIFAPIDLFTFQYGQIRNGINIYNAVNSEKIYIPVWIDQKHVKNVGSSK